MNSESWGCEEAVSALAHYIQDKEITKVMVLTFLDGSMDTSRVTPIIIYSSFFIIQ